MGLDQLTGTDGIKINPVWKNRTAIILCKTIIPSFTHILSKTGLVLEGSECKYNPFTIYFPKTVLKDALNNFIRDSLMEYGAYI